ncbi:hypothetical protein K492DRAFT_175608 [Lichtheimia hyalospora FSU 10163]|nr:hypothetical protein K492DRAFT_175608 [Lichtheimia hyalospora FSU 10163]
MAVFRHSMGSQYSSTSGSSHSHRYSVASTDSYTDTTTRRWSGETSHSVAVDHVPSQPSSPTSYTSLPPSSRFLLSGATSSEDFREQELSRFYPSSMASMVASTTTASLATIADDVQCTSLRTALENATCHGWLCKRETPSFAFARSWKKRYITLTDRILYVFKSDKVTAPAREHFLLTDDTLVFVSEEFKRSHFVLEIRKPLCKWCLRFDSATELKKWLEAMKTVIATSSHHTTTSHGLKQEQYDTTTRAKKHRSAIVETLLPRPPPWWRHYEDNRRSSSPPVPTSISMTNHDTCLSTTTDTTNTITTTITTSSSPTPTTPPTIKRQSLAQIPDWEKTLPPPMPPPQSSPPPAPINNNTASESLTPVSEDH